MNRLLLRANVLSFRANARNLSRRRPYARCFTAFSMTNRRSSPAKIASLFRAPFALRKGRGRFRYHPTGFDQNLRWLMNWSAALGPQVPRS